MFKCNGDTNKKCKCRIIPKTDILNDWSKRILYTKGIKLCGRGGGSCLTPEVVQVVESRVVATMVTKEEAISHLFGF